MSLGRRWCLPVALAGCLTVVGTSCDEQAGPPAAPTTAGEVPVASSPSAGGLWGTPVRPPLPVEPFTLTDQDGRSFTFPRDAGGADVTLLYFGYTHCPDICPDTMAEIAVALRQVRPEIATRVAVVFVTVDPARDDPARLREWIGLFGEDFTGLTGPLRRIESIQRAFGYEPGPTNDLGGGEYVVGHPAEYLAIAPDGTVRLAYPWEITVPQLQEDLTRLVEEGWEA